MDRTWKVAERIKTSELIALGDQGHVGWSEVRFCLPKGRQKQDGARTGLGFHPHP